MDPTTAQVTFAILFIGLNVAIFIWFRRTEAAGSARRTMSMITRVGIDRGIVTSKDPQTGTIMGETRRRCRKCPREDLCERWLAGKVGGSSDFCPNEAVFESQA